MDQVAKQFDAADGYPRPTKPRIEASELKPGDILLSRGDTQISNAIVGGDGGSYSHAALWSGTGVIECVLKGTSEHALDGDRDVYRHPQLTPTAADAIVCFGRDQLGEQYAYTELMMLGMLFAVGINPSRSIVDLALHLLGGGRAENLQRFFDDLASGRAPRVCTELVALAYFRVEFPKFALRVTPKAARPKVAAVKTQGLLVKPAAFHVDTSVEAAASLEALTDLRASCHQLFVKSQLLPPLEAAPPANQGTIETALEPKKLLSGSVALDAVGGHRLGVVTPGDLQFSPSLQFVGRIVTPPQRTAGVGI